MHPEMMQALRVMGLREYLIACPRCGMGGIAMANHDDVEQRECPNCGEELKIVRAPEDKPSRPRRRLVHHLCLLVSSVLLLAAIVFHDFLDLSAAGLAVGLSIAWLLMFWAWLLKPQPPLRHR